MDEKLKKSDNPQDEQKIKKAPVDMILSIILDTILKKLKAEPE